jgi:hypothetical protein
MAASKEFEGGPTDMSVKGSERWQASTWARGSIRAWLDGAITAGEAFGVVDCGCSREVVKD